MNNEPHQITLEEAIASATAGEMSLASSEPVLYQPPAKAPKGGAETFVRPLPLTSVPNGASNPYPVDALGPILNDAAAAIAGEIEVPLAMAGSAVLGVASLCAQGHIDVAPFRRPRPTSLFLLTVAESGERKTACHEMAFEPVAEHEQRMTIAYLEEQDRRAADPEGAKNLPPLNRPELTLKTGTIHGVIEHLQDAVGTMGLVTDEGSTFLGGHAMNSDNIVHTAGTLCGLWDNGKYSSRTVGRGMLNLFGKRIMSLMYIQPVLLPEFAGSTFLDGQGLLPRFLISYPESMMGQRIDLPKDPRWPSDHRLYCKRVQDLLARPMASMGWRKNALMVQAISLEPAAKTGLAAFGREIEKQLGPGGRLRVISGFASKAAEHAARIGAVLQFFQDPDCGNVNADNIERGVTLVRYHMNEMLRVRTHLADGQKLGLAEKVATWLRNNHVADDIDLTTMMQRSPARGKEKAVQVIETLEAYGHLVKSSNGSRGKEAKWRIVPIEGMHTRHRS